MLSSSLTPQMFLCRKLLDESSFVIINLDDDDDEGYSDSQTTLEVPQAIPVACKDLLSVKNLSSSVEPFIFPSLVAEDEDLTDQDTIVLQVWLYFLIFSWSTVCQVQVASVRFQPVLNWSKT